MTATVWMCWPPRAGKLRTWQNRHMRALGKLARRVLARKHAHGVCGGAQEGNALALQRLHKIHILAEEPISRVARLAPACALT